MTEPDGIRRGSPGQEVTGPWFGDGSGKGLAIRHSGDVLMGGASGAGSLLLNTKASQEAACSRAPAAIVPGPEPEPRDAGASRFGEIGSHPPGADGCRKGPGMAGGRSRWQRKRRNRLTPGSDGCHGRPCRAGGRSG